jgi:hypothetical protein
VHAWPLQVGDVVLRGAVVVPKEAKCAFILVPEEVGQAGGYRREGPVAQGALPHTLANARTVRTAPTPPPPRSLSPGH